MKIFYLEAARRLGEALGQTADEILPAMVRPPKPEMGDLGFPCFTLAKKFKKAPPAIAQELVGKIPAGAPFSEVKAVGPYVNFVLSQEALTQKTVERALTTPEAWGKSAAATGKTVVIDYGSPNIAKPLAIHHMRTNVIGAALMRLYDAAGWNVVTVNHLGDWGTTFGQLMVSYKEEEAKNPGQAVDVNRLFELYVKFHATESDDGAKDTAARAWFKKLEDGDEEAVFLWKLFVEESLKPLRRIYERLGLHFDHYLGESFYNDKMDATIQRLGEAGLLTLSDGAEIVDLEAENMPPCLIRKSDGATTYATRDLAAAEYRQKEFTFNRSLYVVANQQELHFRQIFTVLKKMGYEWAETCAHIKFGMLSLAPGVLGEEGGTGSTRKGKVVFLEDVLDKAVEKAREIIAANARDEETEADLDVLAEMVGVGAVVFTEFMQRRQKDIVFTWEKALNMQGDSGVYLQYTHARLSSVLRKYGKDLPGEIEWSRLESPMERDVLCTLAGFSDSIDRAIHEDEPAVVADYLLELCSVFNRMFTDKENHRIITDDEQQTAARVGLVEAVRLTLAKGLALLGLGAPDRM